MMSVNDMFYNDREQPVLVYDNDGGRSGRQQRRGFLSRQDSRNFRSSASPPPSRTHQHSSSWFGHRRGSQSPPRGRHQEFEQQYDVHRRSKHGDRGSPERSNRSTFGRDRSRRSDHSPPPMNYDDHRNHTKYREDYTGYPTESGYTAENGYAYGGGPYPYGYEHSSSRRPRSSSGDPYSSEYYHGEHTSQIPRTYQPAYGGAPTYRKDHLEVVKLRVPLCCEACEERITNHMLALEGVDSVTCDQLKQKVTVTGMAPPSEILRQGRECFKQTRFW